MLHLTTEDGLPSNTVYEIYRDSKGALWIATDKGVARYNGYKFETYTTADGLPTNEIYFTQEDKLGRIWFGTANGELCFYKDGVFHNSINTPFLRLPFKIGHTRIIKNEYDSSVSISFFEYAAFLNIKNDSVTIKRLNVDNHLALVYIGNITKLPGNQYSIVCNVGYTYSPMIKNGDEYRMLKTHSLGRVVNLLADGTTHQKGTTEYYYFSCQDKRYKRDLSDRFYVDDSLISSLAAPGLDGFNIYRMYYEGKHFFLATANGLYINGKQSLFPNEGLSSITQDINNCYWVSSLTNGVYKISANIDTDAVSRGQYTGSVAFSSIVHGKMYFTTSHNDLYQFDTIASRRIFEYGSVQAQQNPSGKSAYVLTDRFKYYSYFKNDNIVIEDVTAKRPKVSRYVNFPYNSSVEAALQSKDGYVYIKSRNARIIRLNYGAIPKNGSLFTGEMHITDEHTTNMVYAMTQGNDGKIWYSTSDGLYKIDNSIGELQRNYSHLTLKNFVFLKDLLVGFNDKSDLYILRNDGSVLKKLDAGGAIWDKIYKLDPSHLLLLSNKNYWIMSVDGNTVDAYVLENQFFPHTVENIATNDTMCYVFSKGDVYSFSIRSLLERPRPPSVYFSKLKYGRANLPIDSSVTLSYDDSRNVTISFSAISFAAADLIFQYSVSNDGQEYWHETKNEEINLLQPNYGTYTVQVRARTRSSEYSKPISFILVIERPFWAKWWFITLCVCATLLLVVVIVRRRISVLVKRNQKEHDAEVRSMRSEYKALNALMNPHFIFNTLNNVQSLINSDDKRAANEYLRVFADIKRQNMHNVSKEVISLQKEIDLVSNYMKLEQLRFEDRLNYSINISEEVDATTINVPPLLIQPLVENSIKHGILPNAGVGRVEVNIFCKENVLVIEVRDDGVGIASAKRNETRALHESFGMENIKKRIEQLSIIQGRKLTIDIGETFDVSGKHLWTIVTITMVLH